jgi:Zinc dependent phospholipase C
MPSGITHIFLTKKLQDTIPDGKLKNIFALGSDFLLIGAVGPDLPYASILDNDFFFGNESPLADRFHYEKTNQIPLESLKEIRSLKGKINEELHYKMFAFFMGYISHVFADGIIHPFVRDMVGNYSENKSAHRSLEMQLDVLLVEEFTKKSGLSLELNYTNVHDELLNLTSYNESKEILVVFSKMIKVVYNEEYSSKKISSWIKGLYRLFAVAEGEHPRIYRNLEANSFLYKNREDIEPEKVLILNKPKDRNLNFLNANQVHFFDDCVSQYFKKFGLVAQKAYEFVYQEGQVLTENDIPPINLDTGRLIAKDDLNETPEFWK